MTRASLMRALRTVPKKFWFVLVCLSIGASLGAHYYYVNRYGPGSDYYTGFLLGSANYLDANVKNLECLQMTLQKLAEAEKRVAELKGGAPATSSDFQKSSGDNCTVRDLKKDSTMEEDAEKLKILEWHTGFRDGWRAQRQKWVNPLLPEGGLLS